MEVVGFVLLVVVVVLYCLWTYNRQQEEEKRKQALEAEQARQRELERKRLFDFFRSKYHLIRKANIEFEKLTNLETGYFTNHQLTLWKDDYSSLMKEIEGKTFENIQLPTEEVQSIKAFINRTRNVSSLRNDFNKRFLQEELQKYNTFFDSVEGRKLDIQQRTAVVTDEDNNIVIAGAGSGKTTTIVGKVNYVIDRYKVDPKEILLISFTNKSAASLAERIQGKAVEAKTFHKFGKDLIVSIEGKQPSIFDEAQFKPLLTRFFEELIRNNSYLQTVTEYFTNFLKPPKSPFDFDNRGDYIQYLKDQNFKSYKQKEIKVNGKVTYKMEVVKSIEECRIANFLLFNGVEYDYELPYEHDTASVAYRQYRPDFTVTQNGEKVYIEHFGISRTGTVPNWFSGDSYRSASVKYRDDMQWKRDTHKNYSTILIESYSYEMNEGILFDNLAKNLRAAGITLNPKSQAEIWKIISEAAKEEITSLITLFGTFITLMKSNDYSIEDVINKNKQTKDSFFKQRNTLFIDIIKPLLKRYEQYLRDRNEIDFSDMINKACHYIQDGTYKRKFRYVIIDEFQDISIGRYKLVKAIKNSNPACKLFCVGDDWQSIYRFSGSDIALFKEFEQYFGFTAKSKIETTYRFHNPLISLSSDFIQKNPSQARKDLKSTAAQGNTGYSIRYSTIGEQDDTSALQEIFDELLRVYQNIEKKEIIILGRYGFDISRIKNEDKVFSINYEKEIVEYSISTPEGERKTVEAKFMTVHKAKGLEGDIVVVINCNSGKYGFPSGMSDDRVLNLLLSEADQYENGEERRLFYVAMTRAKESVYFVADGSFKSKFIAELEVESGQSPNSKCPACKTADLVLKKAGTAKNGNAYKFFGCSNFTYGCDYTITEWINR